MSTGRRTVAPHRRAAVALLALAGAWGTLWPAGAMAGVRGVVVAGLGGTDEYARSFTEDARAIAAALATLDAQDDAVVVLENPGRDVLLDTVRRQAADAQGRLFALVLVGHGTVDADGYRFNIGGPDVGAADLIDALSGSAAARELVVAATSASGALLEVLEQPGRALVTATKSGGELNAVRFGSDFAAAVSDGGAEGGADVDRNEILTLGEAFRHADAAVRRWYEEENLLAPEHARIAGDGAADIALARLGALAAAGDDPRVARLLDERSTLEAEFASLKAARADLAAGDYWSALEALLLRIARLQQSIDEATGWSEGDA